MAITPSDGPADDLALGYTERGSARHRGQIEIVAALLLSAATVLTAWSAFQSAKWSGRQAISFSEASRSRTESVRASTVAGQLAVVDASVFTAWLTATEQGQTDLADLLAARFRDEFDVAFRDWLATDPLTNPSAPPTPFALASYQLAAVREATIIEAQSVAQFRDATRFNQRSDNYVLMTVLAAMAMFFAGISTQFRSTHVQAMLVCAGAVTFVVAVAITATFPVHI